MPLILPAFRSARGERVPDLSPEQCGVAEHANEEGNVDFRRGIAGLVIADYLAAPLALA
jgi:hypothetical protein